MNIIERTARNAAVLATLVVTAAVAPAAAAETAGSIEIRSCYVLSVPTTDKAYDMAVNTEQPSGIAIDFVNHANVPAQDVTFEVGTEAGGVTLTDRGNFAPETLISHTFPTGPNVDASSCRVLSTRFLGDGS